LNPNFFISRYFLSPLGLKKGKKFAIKSVFLVYEKLFCLNQTQFENEGGLVELGGKMLIYVTKNGLCNSYGLKEELVMAS
jgi:hypothetical protein